MTKDDRDGVNSNLAMGTHVALLWATKELGATRIPHAAKRRMLVLTIRAASRQLQEDVTRARRLAAAHTIGMRSLGVKVALLVALAAPAAAQAVVYTNVVNGRPQAEIVRVARPQRPVAPIPASMAVSTPVLPAGYRPPLGPTSYLPPVTAAEVPRPAMTPRAPEPWFVNGIYAGPSPSGQWMSTVVGRPSVDVYIVSPPPPPTPPRRPR